MSRGILLGKIFSSGDYVRGGEITPLPKRLDDRQTTCGLELRYPSNLMAYEFEYRVQLQP